MRLGKLDNDQLERLVLQKFKRTRPESACSPGVGQDCAALDLGGDLAILSCDPITSAGPSHLGRLTVHVSCNDAAAAGAEPVGLLVTLLAPPEATEEDISGIADDLAAAASDAGVDILGGHTEVTDSVTRFVTCATVIARQQKNRALKGLSAGDHIVMTKWAGLEGTSILAEDFVDRLGALPSALLERARLLNKTLSVVPESRIAMTCGATAMHDVTEGGVLGAAWEMAYVGGCGIRLDVSAIPVLPETAAICTALHLDPLRLIGSGSLLVACTNGDALVEALAAAGIQSVCIGIVEGTGLTDISGAPIDPPGADEIYRLSNP